MVTIEKLLKDGLEIIKEREFNNPYLDVQLILSHLLQKDKVYLHLHRRDEVNEETAKMFYEMAERRNAGYPLQYMTNSQEFMGLDFYVQEGVLVPRPDTEILVEKVINIVNNSNLNDKSFKILDIGTGSGAVGVSLGHYLKNSEVTLMDISDVALDTAQKNIEKFGLKNVKILKGDIFKHDFGNEKYNIVVSNPPYIEKDIIETLPVEVAVYEPKLALDGGADGLDYYRQIVKVFNVIHEEGAILSVEIGYDQKDKVSDIFKDANIFNKIECDKDLGGNDRVVTGFL
jgi:release factor glutamine methyltransferase